MLSFLSIPWALGVRRESFCNVTAVVDLRKAIKQHSCQAMQM